MGSISLYLKRNFKFNFDKDLHLKKGLFLFLLLFFLCCSNQKEYCSSSLKEGPDIQGIDSKGAGSLYVYYDNELNKKREDGVITIRENSIVNSMLILCLQKTYKERKCEGKSEFVPHFGY
ncbi:hypothetical protein [Leptospira brenneri]|uniref:hypothetical protein n=1 Tax=Leptospira brenneri TaxID=2023182 RepID=UPI000C29C1F4|nr:hypothetical protein [Leptospira brenneri]PJZ46582.1 hypothetical protein CH361_05760 [Leptospira brenneri]